MLPPKKQQAATTFAFSSVFILLTQLHLHEKRYNVPRGNIPVPLPSIQVSSKSSPTLEASPSSNKHGWESLPLHLCLPHTTLNIS